MDLLLVGLAADLSALSPLLDTITDTFSLAPNCDLLICHYVRNRNIFSAPLR